MYQELPTQNDFEDNFLPMLKDASFRCALCTRTLERISGAHLRSHSDFLLTHQGMKHVRKSDIVIAAEQDMFRTGKLTFGRNALKSFRKHTPGCSVQLVY